MAEACEVKLGGDCNEVDFNKLRELSAEEAKDRSPRESDPSERSRENSLSESSKVRELLLLLIIKGDKESKSDQDNPEYPIESVTIRERRAGAEYVKCDASRNAVGAVGFE